MKPTLTIPDAMNRLLTHHLGSFQANDLDALMTDYTDQSVLITADATFTGRAEIQSFFAALIPLFPTQSTRLELDRVVAIDDLLFIVWHANTPTLKVPMGSDTFLVRHGKIHRQTFVGQLEHISPGK
jgi:hypothetical protein